MSRESNQPSNTKDMPISLQGIEKILIFLNNNDKILFSIREIGYKTKLSTRTVKNILLQLEKFNQVERVIEGNNVIPKWQITKFGKRVLKEAKGVGNNITFSTREEELLKGIVIPQEKFLDNDLKKTLDRALSELNTMQVEISKILGSILNINNPILEETTGFILKRIKFLKQKLTNLFDDRTSQISKVGEKSKKFSKEEIKFNKVEKLLFNSLIINQMKRISDIIIDLSNNVEHLEVNNSLSLANDLRDEIRIISDLINQRESLKIGLNILLKEDLKQLSNNKIAPDILDKIIEIPLSEDVLGREVGETVLTLLNRLNKNETVLIDHNYELTDFIPLFKLFQLILDEKPNLNFTIDKLEETINELSEQGYIPGMKTIRDAENNYLKVVQLKPHDVSQDEIELVKIALKQEKFTLADIIKLTGWSPEHASELLNKLTKLGILNYSRSFLHGERWFVITEQI